MTRQGQQITTAAFVVVVILLTALSAYATRGEAHERHRVLPSTEIVRRTEYVSDPACERFMSKADRLVSLSLLADDVQIKALNAVEEDDLSRLVNLTEKLSAYSTLQSETADAYLASRESCSSALVR